MQVESSSRLCTEYWLHGWDKYYSEYGVTSGGKRRKAGNGDAMDASKRQRPRQAKSQLVFFSDVVV